MDEGKGNEIELLRKYQQLGWLMVVYLHNTASGITVI
jgi:hypothetical protein